MFTEFYMKEGMPGAGLAAAIREGKFSNFFRQLYFILGIF